MKNDIEQDERDWLIAALKRGLTFHDPDASDPHPFEIVNLFDRDVPIDKPLVEIIKILNDNDFITLGCCEQRSEGKAYISFYEPDGLRFLKLIRGIPNNCQLALQTIPLVGASNDTIYLFLSLMVPFDHLFFGWGPGGRFGTF